MLQYSNIYIKIYVNIVWRSKKFMFVGLNLEYKKMFKYTFVRICNKPTIKVYNKM